MERTIRPTLVIGIGEWGAQVAAAFARRAAKRAGPSPLLRAVALVADGMDLPATLTHELEQIRRLDAVQAARHAGWRVEGAPGSEVALVAALDDERIGRAVSDVARLLHEHSERDLACRLVLSAILWVPRGEEARSEPSSRGHPFADLLLFDGGCYLVSQVNAQGLLVGSGAEQAERVADWLVLGATTPLPAVLDRLPPAENDHAFSTLGLAAWEFPLETLTAHLARRWQHEALGRFLVPSDAGPGLAAAFLERHGRISLPWSQEVPLRFQVLSDDWTAPPLDLVHTLPLEIDEAVQGEGARLGELFAQGDAALDALCDEGQRVLATEVDALLDGPGLGTAVAFLNALEEAARLRTVELERESERSSARVHELDERAQEAGRVLSDLAARFPPVGLRTLVRLALRPWRWLDLWLSYREIGRRAGVYLAYRQGQWLLQAEARQYQWQAAFCARLAQAAQEEKEAVVGLRTRLDQLCARLAPAPALEQALARALEAAALPAGLAGHFYRQVTGSGGVTLTGMLALYGPLSRWVCQECDAEALNLTLAEYAREQFDFLAGIRLDELLARTYDEAELRRRLAMLVEAAAPWWAYDEAALSAEERARLYRLTLVGLPEAGDSLLADLLDDRRLSCFSTGDDHLVVVAQVIQGLPLTALARQAESRTCSGGRATAPNELGTPKVGDSDPPCVLVFSSPGWAGVGGERWYEDCGSDR